MATWWIDVLQDAARSPVVAAWFTAMGALIAATVSAIVSYVVSRRSVYINAVTAERSKWIEALRGNVSAFSGAADRLSALRSGATAIDSKEWATHAGELHSLLSELTLRLNPSEPEARNLLRCAKRLEAATRLHSPASVILADEIMIRHAQWVLKAEWERVKQEASGPLQAPFFWFRRSRRRHAYQRFLAGPGSLSRLDQIAAGKTDLQLTMLRTEMNNLIE
ncbi:hypothetical protein B5P46_01975 [Rhizobium leguminosarum]|uniref:Uncharacterized protein n=1 Tax=Rhizobium leguminosarum TaxID=384 RepID=A0A4Q1UD03_RHILE|nr:hypothetical protein B5P46_01975 [Rhizobium leguminosarum]